MRDVFEVKQALRAGEAKSDHRRRMIYGVSVSVVELYNERLVDLLQLPDRKTHLRIRECPHHGIWIDAVSVEAVRDMSAFENLHRRALVQRAVAATMMSQSSSRSSLFTFVHIDTMEPAPTGLRARRHTLLLVDLAGSERMPKLKAEGTLLAEARSISRSLSSLLQVVLARDKQQNTKKTYVHVPYRDSMLTRLLTDYLGGSAVMLMVATVGPAGGHCEETTRTLKLAEVFGGLRRCPTNKHPQILFSQFRTDGDSVGNGAAAVATTTTTAAPVTSPTAASSTIRDMPCRCVWVQGFEEMAKAHMFSRNPDWS
jgi:hypothetical protein